jgi:hypothetical protein
LSRLSRENNVSSKTIEKNLLPLLLRSLGVTYDELKLTKSSINDKLRIVVKNINKSSNAESVDEKAFNNRIRNTIKTNHHKAKHPSEKKYLNGKELLLKTLSKQGISQLEYFAQWLDSKLANDAYATFVWCGKYPHRSKSNRIEMFYFLDSNIAQDQFKFAESSKEVSSNKPENLKQQEIDKVIALRQLLSFVGFESQQISTILNDFRAYKKIGNNEYSLPTLAQEELDELKKHCKFKYQNVSSVSRERKRKIQLLIELMQEQTSFCYIFRCPRNKKTEAPKHSWHLLFTDDGGEKQSPWLDKLKPGNKSKKT